MKDPIWYSNRFVSIVLDSTSFKVLDKDTTSLCCSLFVDAVSPQSQSVYLVMVCNKVKYLTVSWVCFGLVAAENIGWGKTATSVGV